MMTKRKYGVALLMFLMFSCEQEEMIPTEQGVDLLKHELTKKESIYFDWENAPQLRFGDDGTLYTLPWYSGAPTQLPDFILQEYTKADGWELMYNFCSEDGDPGKNYLIFYNKFTGVVRSYYYVSHNPSGNSNDGMWALNMPGTHALLNNVGYFAKPMDYLVNNPIAISTNISMEPLTKAFAFGWNAFDTEITYDSNLNKSIRMGVATYNKNISDFTVSGGFNSNSEGAIITTNTTNQAQNFTNNAAKAAGKSAGSWIKENVGTKDNASKIIKLAASVLPDIASGGVSTLVKEGINLVFGSFIGKQSNTTNTKQSLEFKTNGTISLSGQITGTGGSNVVPIANLYVPMTQMSSTYNLPHYNKRLGVWNLATTPVVKEAAQAVLVGQNSYQYVYNRDVYVDQSSINIVINPDILSEIDRYETKVDLVYYAKFQGELNWNGPEQGYGTPPPSGNLIYKDDANEFWKIFGEEIYGGEPDYPSTWPSMPSGQILGVPYIRYPYVNNKYVVKVTVTLYPKAGYNQEPVTITRSYIPNVKLYNLAYAYPEDRV
ncbi:hypothetical protein [Pontibacter sp. SGAir0037]|uniref:hypothetical protein n=1 Tax=Pontibacter sp. SGAir0037 TaxID=2571030 RepID=UPI0010F4D015|nr:hypothetical protein [Pontibacter sp. SGAir0037]